MKNLKTITTLILLAAFYFVINPGCKKDRIEEPEPDPLKEYSSINNYFDSKKQEEQEFIIDTSGSGPIVGNQGTKIWIWKGCLEFPNGDTVSWPYTVKLVELYTPKDMIYYQMPTITSGKIMETDGEIRLRAFKDGIELKLKAGCYVPIEMVNGSPKSYMRVYYGFETGGYPDWTDDPSALGVSTTITPDFSTSAGGYLDSIVILGWINCGFQVGTGAGYTITFTSTTDNLQNVGIFIYFPNTATVMQVYNKVSGLIPNGSDVKIVGIGVDGSGQLFSFDQTKTVTSSSSLSVTLNSISDGALTSLLDAL